MQKKMIPWGHSAPDADLELAFRARAAKLGKATSRLIVVASLIDKPTNLGGKRAAGSLEPQPPPGATWAGGRPGAPSLLLQTRPRAPQACAAPARCSGRRRWW